MGDREQYDDDDDNDLSPKAKSIHIIMRPDEDGETRKITEQERKNMKRQFKQVFEQFPEDETAFFEDSKAAKIAGQNYSKNTQKNKKDKKDKVLD